MELKRILWPTDFSENAAAALPVVTSLSQKYQAEVHILSVLIDMVVMASRGSESHFDFGSVADRVIKCTATPTLIIPV